MDLDRVPLLREDEEVEPEDDSELEGEIDSSSACSGDVEDEEDREINFDISLPSTHSYLGDNMDDFTGCTLQPEYSKVTLPLYPLPNLVLMPGQILPLHIFEPMYVSMVRNLLSTDRTFAFVYLDYENDPADLKGHIGCTSQIYSARQSDSDSDMDMMCLKTIGRQRFEVLATRRQATGIYTVDVKILPDNLPPPIPRSLFVCPPRFAPICHPDKKENASFDAPPSYYAGGKARRQVLKMRCRPDSLCPWPYQVFKQFDINTGVTRAQKELLSWTQLISMDSLPKDPVCLSFWLSSRLPMRDATRQELLTLNCPLRRLLRLVQLMQSCRTLVCADCHTVICKRKDIFSMSEEGPQAAYVNPYGHVHETLTVYEASGVRLQGLPVLEDSWFPGYAWTISNCRRCYGHIGWKFTAVQPSMKPAFFYGISRQHIEPEVDGV